MTALALFYSLFAVVLAAITADGWAKASLAAAVGIGASWLYFFLWFRLLVGSQRRGLRLHIGAEGICRQYGAVRKLVPWEQMTRVRIKAARWPFDDSVEVYTTEGLALDLYEFERVGEIAEEIQTRMGTSVPVDRGLGRGHRHG